MKESFSKVRQEMDDHKETLNQLTLELEGVYEWITRFENMMSNMNDRIVQIPASQSPIETLSLREQELFVLLYSSDNPVSLAELSEKLGFSTQNVQSIADSLVIKGVPLLRRPTSEGVFFSMELKFKQLQAQQGIVRINSLVTQQIFSQKNE